MLNFGCGLFFLGFYMVLYPMFTLLYFYYFFFRVFVSGACLVIVVCLGLTLWFGGQLIFCIS